MVEDISGQQEHVGRTLPRGMQHLPQRMKVIAAVVQAKMQIRAMDEDKIAC